SVLGIPPRTGMRRRGAGVDAMGDRLGCSTKTSPNAATCSRYHGARSAQTRHRNGGSCFLGKPLSQAWPGMRAGRAASEATPGEVLQSRRGEARNPYACSFVRRTLRDKGLAFTPEHARCTVRAQKSYDP